MEATFEFDVPEDSRVPAERRAAALAALHARHAKDLAVLSKATDARQELLEERRAALVRLAGGARKYAELRKLLRRERRKLGNQWVMVPGQDADPAVRRMREAIWKKMGFSKAQRRPPAVRWTDGDPLIALPKGAMSQSNGQLINYQTGPTGGTWTTATAPYLGGHTKSGEWHIGGTFGAYVGYDYLSGPKQIGNMVSLRNGTDPTDDDYAWIRLATARSFWFFTTTAGPIEAQVRLRAVTEMAGLSFHAWFRDRSGWSDSSTFQQSSIYFSVNGLRTEKVLAWRKLLGQTDGTFNEWYYFDWDGATDFHFITPQRFPINTWVLVEVGSVNYQSASMNDVQTDQNVHTRWRLQQVRIRST